MTKTSKKTKTILEATIASVVSLGLAGCYHPNYVACYGVTQPGDKDRYVVMDEGLCSKLAGGDAKPLPPNVQIPKVNMNDYVKCYGVAAGGKNDCGTQTTACSGSVSQPKDPGAWVAALEGVCKKVGGRVGKITSSGRTEKNP